MYWYTRSSANARRNHIFVTLTLILSQYVNDGYAVKCFVCDSTDNPSCADLKTNSSLIAEECTLENMKSIDSWLFELNALAFYKTAVYSNPLFNCQKVVAREPRLNRVVTARFCQLHTADSDACKILQNKMQKQEAERQNNGFSMNGGRNDGSGGSGGGSGSSRRNTFNAYDTGDDGVNSKERLMHCSICSEDRCNVGVHPYSRHGNSLFTMLLSLPVILQKLLSLTYW